MAGMVVQHNMNALNAYNRLNTNVNGLKKSSEKLSSGYRINRAGDDAAGLAISEKMRSQIRGLNQAKRNSQDGISMIQTFEGALQETHSILQRMKELATESANGTYDDATDRAAIQLEFDQLNDELNQIADTDFNGVVVLNGGEMADGLKAADGKFDYAAAKAAAEAAAANAPKDMAAADYSEKPASIDDSKYTQAKADDLWAQAELDTYAAAADSNEIEIKYEITGVDDDGKVTGWKATYADGTEYSGTVTTTDNGGFVDDVTGATVVTDTIGAKVGDFVTVKYTNPAGKEQAPTNIGFEDSNVEGTGVAIVDGSADIISLDQAKTAEIEIHADVDTNWTDPATKADYQEAIQLLDGAKVVVDYDSGTTAANADVAASAAKVVDAEGNELTDFVVDEGTGAITYNGKNIATMTFAKGTATATQNQTASVEYTIALDGYRVASDEKPNAALVEATAAEEEAAGVSVSNAYENSTAILTYKEDITLQVGARSKDAVNFTFNYNKADMGELESNLNVSAREGGLETAALSLADQESANHAIDQIDKAINKVSMVRATFGAMQNRLEHKIENITTTSENLTEAESAIRDTDMASEMMNYTKFNILQQAAQSMLAQANQQPQSILQLLG